ncbi:MAG TPA: filamentous hemagglutinin N-terminal domain-containing protein, partial [Zoogloea sp.]|nr:filamentous hemagglutinin N-terminal domain-containing protein [Zoogloea sp.]
MLALWRSAFALPTDPSVVAGQAVVKAAGTTGLVINQSSGKAAIDWRTFNVGANESVRFNQPSAAAMTVNRVTSNDPSQILGQISAPGSVFLINPSGIIFGRSAVVDVGNLVATTLTASTADLLNGRNVFSLAPGGSGSVRNEGLISASPGGSVSLIGPRVVNTGTIATPGGTTGLVAGERISVDFEGDGLVRYQVDAGAAQALVEHSGQIVADGGRVAIQASARDALLDTVLNVDGVVRARGVSVRNGEIYLDGGSRGTVQVSGTLDASGGAAQAAGGQIRVLGENVGLFGAARLDASGASGGGSVLIGGNYQGQGPEHNATRTFVGRDVSISADAVTGGNGGKVIVWADDWTRFYGAISARGGVRAGDGGFVEVSGKHNLTFDGNVETSAPAGKMGMLFLDPADLHIVASPPPSDPNDLSSTTATAFSTPLVDPAPLGTVNYYVSANSLSRATSYTLTALNEVKFETTVNFGSTGANTVSVTGGTAIRSAGQIITTAGAPLTLTAPTVELGSINTNGGALTIDNSIAGTQGAGAVIAGGGALIKQGAGSLALSNANDYTGGTFVNAGTVAASQSLGLGRSNGAVTVNGGELRFDSAISRSGDVTLTGGKLNINGKAVSLGTLSGSAGEVALGAGTLTVVQGATGEFAGLISGAGGNLVKNGTATLTLSNANTYTGTTTINDGTLSITNNAGLRAGTDVNVNSGGTLDIKDANLNALNLGLSGQGNASAGALTGSGVAGYAGDLTLDADAYIGGTGILSLGGALQGVPPRQLTKVGTGTLVLESGGSFRGDTTIASGTVSVRNGAALGTGAVTVSSGGTLNIDGAILSAASLTLNGSGTPA